MTKFETKFLGDLGGLAIFPGLVEYGTIRDKPDGRPKPIAEKHVGRTHVFDLDRFAQVRKMADAYAKA